MTTRRRVLLVAGFVSLVFATIPWLGFGCCAFAVPGFDMLLPRLSLLSETAMPCGELLYGVTQTPLLLIGSIPPFGDMVFYSGEGVVRVRPFMIFVFWLIAGMLAVWISVRPMLIPKLYGQLERDPSSKNNG